ncbi:MAG: hypothetical protein WKF65_09590 [Gaiellaceae bacterium]
MTLAVQYCARIGKRKVRHSFDGLSPSASFSTLGGLVTTSSEAAIVSALLAAEAMTGRDGVTARAFEPELLVSALRR